MQILKKQPNRHATSIHLQMDTRKKLKRLKTRPMESYDEVIRRLLK